ncbi:MAG: crotonobetainyl-CoA:carnitine CoA-transferase CaiB-like acyl-CoA transferase [Paracoccaceae bacterium]|jgi:crotonobetainyl-CoA:carnitine CoA-transferase CaiB-like acyl-CoA transferase
MGVTGIPGEGPMRAGAAVADSTAGLYASTAILIALAEREKSGQGQWVATSLLEAQIALMDFQAARYLVEGEVPPQSGNEHPYVTPMGVVATADGYLNLGVAGDAQWLSFCRAIDRADWAERPEYRDSVSRFESRPQLWSALAPIFVQRSTNEWVDLLETFGVPAGPIYTMDQVFADAQVRHLGMAVAVHHPVRGDTQVVGQPITMSRTPASVYTAASDAGAHTDTLLGEFGLSGAEIAALRAKNVI